MRNAVAGQLPQDVFYINYGGNWTLADNRCLLLVGATVLFILNIPSSAGMPSASVNNSVHASERRCRLWLHVSGKRLPPLHRERHAVLVLEHRVAMLVVNANANGGTANGGSFGALGTVGGSAVFAKDQWQNQRVYMAWNYPLAKAVPPRCSPCGHGAVERF